MLHSSAVWEATALEGWPRSWEAAEPKVLARSDLVIAMNTKALINDFAIRSFRDTADGDYIAARMAFRVALLQQFFWSSQQAVENT